MAKPLTRQLARAHVRLQMTQRRSWGWPMAAIALAVVSLGAYAVMHTQPKGESPADLARMLAESRQENEQLKLATERAQLDARHEAATRQALEQQIKDMSVQVKRLQDELTFLRSQRNSDKQQ